MPSSEAEERWEMCRSHGTVLLLRVCLPKCLPRVSAASVLNNVLLYVDDCESLSAVNFQQFRDQVFQL